MPFNGSGTYSPPSAPAFPAVTQTIISSTHYNSVINDIASALTGCVTRDGQSPMTGPLPMGGQTITALGLGSAASPAIGFTGAASTGIYAPGAGQFGISIGGTAAYTVNANRQHTIAAQTSGDALTITAPGSHIGSNAITASVYRNTAGSGIATFTNAAPGGGSFYIGVGATGTTRAAGVVGLGNLAAGDSILINASGDIAIPIGLFHYQNHALRIGKAGSGTGGQIRLNNDAGVSAWQCGLLGSAGAVNFTLYYEPTTRMVLTATPNGNVLISTPASGAGLRINAGASSPALLVDTNADGATVDLYGRSADGLSVLTLRNNAGTTIRGAIAANDANGLILYREGLNTAATVGAGGNWVIFTPTSGTAFTVNGITSNNHFIWTDGTRSGGLQTDTNNVYMGAITNHGTALLSNNAVRIQMSNAGRIQFGTGGTQWEIDTSNRLLNPGNTQPSTLLISSGGRTTTGDFGSYTQDHNQSNTVNTTNGTIQVPVAGVYFVAFRILTQVFTGANFITASLAVNGVNRSADFTVNDSRSIDAGGAGGISLAVSGLLRLAANDTLKVVLTNIVGPGNTNCQLFSVHLVS